MKFEENLKQLEMAVEELETNQNLSLEKSMELFEKGMTYAKDCYEEIRKTQGKLQILNEELQKFDWNINESI